VLSVSQRSALLLPYEDMQMNLRPQTLPRTALDLQPRFILMSGDTSSRDLPAIRAGAVRWLTKPFSPAKVLETVRDALGR
jgi:CheY-like chemotaxis protein